MKEPKFRTGTRKAIEKLAQELRLPQEDYMQDWPLEAVNPQDIEKYIAHYQLTFDEDSKFVLMEMMIQAANDQSNQTNFLKYWETIREALMKDFKIHEYTIFYWSCLDSQSPDEEFNISPYMRGIWPTE